MHGGDNSFHKAACPPVQPGIPASLPAKPTDSTTKQLAEMQNAPPKTRVERGSLPLFGLTALEPLRNQPPACDKGCQGPFGEGQHRIGWLDVEAPWNDLGEQDPRSHRPYWRRHKMSGAQRSYLVIDGRKLSQVQAASFARAADSEGIKTEVGPLNLP